MRVAKALALFFVVVFLGGALIAPWLHAMAQSLAESFPAFERTANQPLHRYVNRCLLVLALIGMWPLSRSFGIRSKTEMGLTFDAKARAELFRGLVVGFLMLAVVAVVAVLSGGRVWEGTRSGADLLKHVGKAFLTATVVALIEEVFFRGAIFGVLRREIGVPKALFISSAIYSIVHFFERSPSPQIVEWSSGFWVLGQMLRGFVQIDQLIPGFLTLLMAGALLALAFKHTGSLYFSIGLHAGWIFWLKTYGYVTRAGDAPASTLLGTGKLLDGWLAFLVVGGALAVYAWKMRNTPSKSET